MTFAEKISIVLETNELGIATMEDLSEKAGFHRDTIRKAIDRGSQLNKGNTRIFTDKIGINRTWWETGKGDVFIKKPTPVENGSDNKEIPAGVNLDEESRKLLAVANKTVQYAFVPKTILEGEYRIELKSAIDEQTELRREAIQGYKKLVKKLEEEIADLRSGKIPIRTTASQNAK